MAHRRKPAIEIFPRAVCAMSLDAMYAQGRRRGRFKSVSVTTNTIEMNASVAMTVTACGEQT